MGPKTVDDDDDDDNNEEDDPIHTILLKEVKLLSSFSSPNFLESFFSFYH